MAARLRAVKRPVYLYFRFLGQQMKAILAYEADFVVLLFAAVLVQLAGFAFIWTIFQRIPSINGWTLWQVVMMYSLIFITEGVVSLFFEGTWRLGWLVYSGQFDQMLVRPVSPIVQVLAGSGRLQRPRQHRDRRHPDRRQPLQRADGMDARARC